MLGALCNDYIGSADLVSNKLFNIVRKNVLFAGQVGAAGHLTIGDNVIATAQTGIARSVESGSKISGTPEMDSGLWKKNYILMHRFPEITRTIRKLEKKVRALEDQIENQQSEIEN